MKKTDIYKKLELLAKKPGYIYALAPMLLHDLYYSLEEAVDINWRERLSFQEFSYLIGLMVKNEIDLDTIPSKEKFNNYIKETYSLFKELKMAYMAPFFDKLKTTKPHKPTDSKSIEQSFQEFFGSGEMMTEPIFYDDSGAYDFQYWELAPKLYQKDRKWIMENYGMDIDRAVLFSKRTKRMSEQKARKLQLNPKRPKKSWKNILDSFCFSKKDFSGYSQKQIEIFLNNFSIRPGNINRQFCRPGQYNKIESHPIIQLKDDYYFLPISFNLSKSVYESPFYWMSNSKAYADVSFKNRGDATEKMAHHMLQKVFGKSNVFRGVKVYKSKKKSLTDIDILAITGNKAVVVQAKSKKLTELGRQGDDDKIRDDFQKAIQDAYDQGMASRKALLGKNYKLKDISKREKCLAESLEDVYIICLTTDHYSAVPHQLSTYLVKKKEEPSPIAISLFDLDILTHYLSDPFEFLYYLRQRISLSDYFYGGNEIGYMAYHLKQKLFKVPGFDRVAIDQSWAQCVDADFMVSRGYAPKPKSPSKIRNKWTNKKFLSIVDQIKKTRNLGFTDTVFFLYDLAGKGADELIEWIIKTKRKSEKDGKNHDFTMIYDNGKAGITYICQIGAPRILLRDLMLLSQARKYKTKADMWIGFGSLLSSKNLIDVMVFNKEKWKRNKRLEKLSKIALKKGTEIKLS